MGMTETNAERIERMKLNGLVGTQETRNGLMESVDGLMDGDFKWIIEQAERAQKQELLLQGNDGMSVLEIRQQFVDLHQSSLHIENRIESAEAVIGFYAADMTYELHEDRRGQLYTDIEKDRGRRARMYLRRESNEGGKNKGPTPN